jgi:hypothetical protein
VQFTNLPVPCFAIELERETLDFLQKTVVQKFDEQKSVPQIIGNAI